MVLILLSETMLEHLPDLRDISVALSDLMVGRGNTFCWIDWYVFCRFKIIDLVVVIKNHGEMGLWVEIHDSLFDLSWPI